MSPSEPLSGSPSWGGKRILLLTRQHKGYGLALLRFDFTSVLAFSGDSRGVGDVSCPQSRPLSVLDASRWTGGYPPASFAAGQGCVLVLMWRRKA